MYSYQTTVTLSSVLDHDRDHDILPSAVLEDGHVAFCTSPRPYCSLYLATNLMSSILVHDYVALCTRLPAYCPLYYSVTIFCPVLDHDHAVFSDDEHDIFSIRPGPSCPLYWNTSLLPSVQHHGHFVLCSRL